MADKTKDAKKDDARMSSIAKTLNKVEDRLEKSENCDSVAEGLANAAKASELLSSVWTLPPTQLLRFHHDTKVSDIDGDSTPGFDGNKDDAERFISISSSEIARYQRLMYANGVKGSHRRLLIVLQGMDASGKGGIVRHVFSQGDPMGMHYHGFGAPKGEELDHDYLWRIKRELPNNGWISIFDRSHYEDIVMPRIYKTQPEEVWQARYDEINRFESQLTADGCAIIKIFLVVSKDEQKRHFLSRLDDPTKCWKFDPSDLEARARWDDYMAAWQDVFLRTSTEQAPWYLVPADNRWYSRAVVSELLRIYKTQPEEVWQARYDEINRFESQLTADGCAIIKIFLVVSKDEQKRHFLSRLDDPTKCWKFDPSDLEARARWDDYMAAWQDVFLRTSTEQAPWYLVPADNRWYSRAVVSELLRNTLKNMNMIWPPLEVDADEMRRQLDTL